MPRPLYALRRVSPGPENRRLHKALPQHVAMALLVDKHRPRNLEALSYHPELSDRLRALVSSQRSSLAMHLTEATTLRRKAVTSHICSYTVPLVQARKRVLSRPSRNFMALVSKRSRSTRVSSKPPQTANSNSTSSPPSTTSKSHPQM